MEGNGLVRLCLGQVGNKPVQSRDNDFALSRQQAQPVRACLTYQGRPNKSPAQRRNVKLGNRFPSLGRKGSNLQPPG